MRVSLRVWVLAAGLLCGLVASGARADIYKLVNDQGGVTFSNVPPRDRSRILEVFPAPELPSRAAPPAAAAQQAAELQSLVDRFDRLAQALEDERRANAAPPVPQYAPPAPDPWYGWDFWYPGPYFAPAVVISTPFAGRVHPFHGFRHGHQFPRNHHANHGAFRSQPGFAPRTGGNPRTNAPRAGGRRR